MAKIDQYFEFMMEMNASDLHFQEGQPPKVRLHGEILPLDVPPLGHEMIREVLSEACGSDRWAYFNKKGDLDYAYEMGQDCRFRTNYMKQVSGIGALFRLIPSKIKTLEDLGVPARVRSLARAKGGLVLVTGPTGSGKSTTLAAVIDFMNVHFAKHIVTIEEPIEFVHQNKLSVVTQREVPIHTPSFRDGLKAALREDADAILVGEMRDLETIALALTAAETGVLVLGTLHTSSARKTVDRIIDAFPADRQPQIRTMLASSLRGVIAQILLRRKDGQGRLAAFELLLTSPAVSSIIREGKTEKMVDILISGKGEGMHIMDDSIMAFLEQGLIAPVEAYAKANDKSKFEKYIKN
jgi:twitching motility protein PilT